MILSRVLTLSLVCLVSFLSVLFTATSTAQAERSRITLGSCNKQNSSQKIWNSIASEKSDLFLYLGDTIYADTDDMVKKIKIYETLFSSPDFSNFFASTRVSLLRNETYFGE